MKPDLGGESHWLFPNRYCDYWRFSFLLTFSHVHQLCSIETCQTSSHALRWKDRPLQCPRCHSADVDPWGTYHYRPGCKRYWCNGCKRPFNDLPHTLLHRL